jgi:hypothetical protein
MQRDETSDITALKMSDIPIKRVIFCKNMIMDKKVFEVLK